MGCKPTEKCMPLLCRERHQSPLDARPLARPAGVLRCSLRSRWLSSASFGAPASFATSQHRFRGHLTGRRYRPRPCARLLQACFFDLHASRSSRPLHQAFRATPSCSWRQAPARMASATPALGANGTTCRRPQRVPSAATPSWLPASSSQEPPFSNGIACARAPAPAHRSGDKLPRRHQRSSRATPPMATPRARPGRHRPHSAHRGPQSHRRGRRALHVATPPRRSSVARPCSRWPWSPALSACPDATLHPTCAARRRRPRGIRVLPYRARSWPQGVGGGCRRKTRLPSREHAAQLGRCLLAEHAQPWHLRHMYNQPMAHFADGLTWTSCNNFSMAGPATLGMASGNSSCKRKRTHAARNSSVPLGRVASSMKWSNIARNAVGQRPHRRFHAAVWVLR